MEVAKLSFSVLAGYKLSILCYWAAVFSMGMCLPCLGGAADDVIQTPDPVSILLVIKQLKFKI